MNLKEGQRVSTADGIKTIAAFDYDILGKDGTRGRIFMKEDKVDNMYRNCYSYKDIIEINIL